MYEIKSIFSKDHEIYEKKSYSAKITVTSSNSEIYPEKIFVYQAENPKDPNTRGWFTAVATASQIYEFPEDHPVNENEATNQIPYYRLGNVTLVSRSASKIQDLIKEIKSEIKLLEKDLEAVRKLDQT